MEGGAAEGSGGGEGAVVPLLLMAQCDLREERAVGPWTRPFMGLEGGGGGGGAREGWVCYIFVRLATPPAQCALWSLWCGLTLLGDRIALACFCPMCHRRFQFVCFWGAGKREGGGVGEGLDCTGRCCLVASTTKQLSLIVTCPLLQRVLKKVLTGVFWSYCECHETLETTHHLSLRGMQAEEVPDSWLESCNPLVCA